MNIINADCINAIEKLITDGVQVDAIVTDPPYELGFMNKDWDKSGIAYSKELWELCLQILKPGGHLLSFGGSRTYHRMACAIENAGFEIRDQIMWIYGSGFPKSLDISKAVDKTLGEDRPRNIVPMQRSKLHGDRPWMNDSDHKFQSNGPISDDAKQWQGFGTALKPAHEPIVLARKPLSEATIAANVLKYKTGAINIDGCRVATNETIANHSRSLEAAISKGKYGNSTKQDTHQKHGQTLGRFPANLIHDGSEAVVDNFPSAKGQQGKITGKEPSDKTTNCYGSYKERTSSIPRIEDATTAARFFYCAKASKKERNGSKHPTVKPLALMRYLCRLITPPGGLILDPFAGSGTTGQAAKLEGFNYILIEKNQEYVADIERRVA